MSLRDKLIKFIDEYADIYTGVIKISDYISHPSSYYKYIIDKFNEQNVQGDIL